MFSYRCLDCGKKNVYNTAYVDGMEVACLRCGRAIAPSRDLIQEEVVAATSSASTGTKGSRASGITILGKPATPAQKGGTPTKTMAAGKASLNNSGTRNASQPTSSTQKGKPVTRGSSKSAAAVETEEILSDDADDVEIDDKPSGDEEGEYEVEENSGKKAPVSKKESGGGFALGKLPRAVQLGVPIGLVLLLGGGYWFWSGGSGNAKKPPVPKAPIVPPITVAENNSQEKKSDADGTAPKPSGPPATPEKKPDNGQAARPYAVISAVRLGNEILENLSDSNSRYQGRILLVSGLIEEIVLPRIAPPPMPTDDGNPPATPDAEGKPASPVKPVPNPANGLFVSLTFKTDNRPIRCEIPIPDPEMLETWKTMNRSQPLTLRGEYNKGGKLIGCTLVQPPQAPGDALFKGKEVEITGEVVRLSLEGDDEDTFPLIRFRDYDSSQIEAKFWFPKNNKDRASPDYDRLLAVKNGEKVTIRGKCSGRSLDGNRYKIRINNCRIVDTTASEVDDVSRIEFVDFLRAYEEDLRDYFLPARKLVKIIEGYYSIDGLAEKSAADPKYLLQFRNKIMNITGRVGKQEGNRMVLESESTDQPWKVTCQFDSQRLPDFKDHVHVEIQGFCRLTNNNRDIQLIHCQANHLGINVIPRLAADFLPHKPDTTRIYDIVTYIKPNLGNIRREVHYLNKNNLTESYITNFGTTKDRSILGNGHLDTWVNSPKTGKKVIKGPIFSQYEKDGKIYFGPADLEQDQLTGQTTSQKVNKFHGPLIKIDAKAGESWKEIINNVKHEYYVDSFGEWRGQDSVVIKEMVVSPLPTEPMHEIRHLFVRNHGEVERQDWMVRINPINPTEKKIYLEIKWIFKEDLPVFPGDEGLMPEPDKKSPSPKKPG